MKREQSSIGRVRQGFTIIELLMVVAIISIVVMWALPKFSIARYRADAAGRLVRTLLQTAQRNAITRQSDVIASFDLTGNRLRLVQDLNNNNAIDAGELVQYRPLEEGARFIIPTWAGVNGTIPTTAVTGSGLTTVSSLTSVIFRRDGSASTNLEVYVTTRDAVKVEYRAVTLVSSTGRTEMYKWNGTTWLRMTQ
jgi:prepilin-type N-terminal cleavage/methylation domain-containing protein